MSRVSNGRGVAVRRTSIIRKITSYPADKWMSFIETYETIDWDRFHQTGIPIGVVMNMLYFCARAYSNLKLGVAFWLQCTLCFLSIWNTIYFFQRKKKYQIRHFQQDNPPYSVNLRLVDDYFELNQWDLSLFNRNLFCTFSPIQILMLNFFKVTIYNFCILCLVPMVLLFVFDRMQELNQDNQIVFGHVLREYNVKFVYPNLNPNTKEQGVGPEETYWANPYKKQKNIFQSYE